MNDHFHDSKSERLLPRDLHSAEERIVHPTPLSEYPGLKVIGYNTFHSSYELGWHHHDFFELCFVEEGEVVWEYEGTGMKVSGNELSITPPGLIHRGMENVIRPCRLFWLQFDPQLRELGLEEGERLSALDRMRSAPAVWQSGADRLPALQGLMLSLQQKDHLRAAGNFLILLSMILEDLTGSHPGRAEDGRWSQVIAYIEDRITEELHISELSDIFGIHPSVFSDLFRRHTGVLPKHYILMRRVELARTMLSEGDAPVTHIAYDLGFSSGQHFSNTFKKYTGMTPSQWRLGAIP